MILLPEKSGGSSKWGYDKLSKAQQDDVAARANARVEKDLNLQAERPLITDWDRRKALALEVAKKQKS